MNIDVTNLDLGYTQCEDLNTLVSNSGTSLISNLETDITNLKAHWKGADAKEHINNLAVVHDVLVELVTDAKAATSEAGGAIIRIQTVRRDNGGSGNVGSELSGAAPESTPVARLEDTTEYFCDPEAKSDYELLVTICEDFSKFVTEFQSQADELFSNWKAGCHRDDEGGAKPTFDAFVNNADTYNTYLTKARDNLEIAVSNIASLG